MKISPWLSLFTCLTVSYCFSQDSATAVVHINKIPPEGILLDKGWKFHEGDDSAWAKPDFNDHQWQGINPIVNIYHLSKLRNANIGWFRLWLKIDTSLTDQAFYFSITQVGATEIYLNGHLLGRLVW